MKRNVIAAIMAPILAAAGIAAAEDLNSFDDCAKAGYPVMESYPRLCKTPDGRTFTEMTSRQTTNPRPCARQSEMCGGIAGILCCAGLDCKLSGTYPDAGGTCEAQTSSSICEPGKEYKNTAVEPVKCKCPEGYELKVIEMSWGPCPQEGMHDCPASVLTCVSIK